MQAWASKPLKFPDIDAAPKPNQAKTLVHIVDLEQVFLAPDRDTVYATVSVDGHRETWPVRSRGFKRWITRKFFAIEEKPPGSQALQDALGTIEARAQSLTTTYPVHVRVAEHDRDIYIDLGDASWSAVRVTAEGWTVVTDPPVKFRRAKGMQALPYPKAGGSLDELRRFVNVHDDMFELLLAWLVAAVRPRGPYPVLVLGGEHGSAKSTTTKVLRKLIDPNSSELRSQPRGERDLMIAATNASIIAYDNVSALPQWLSDTLCRLATGGGFGTRQLYTDDDEIIFEAQRPVIVNGIEEIVVRPDLLDRAILVNLPVINEETRRTEQDFWADFNAAHSRLFGALLDRAGSALRNIDSMRLARKPRMADFALWAAAALPDSAEAFLTAYDGNRSQAHELVLDAAPVAAMVRELAERDGWSGTATELLKELEAEAADATKRLKEWPGTGRALTGALKRIAPNLRAVGVDVLFHDDRKLGSRRRQITVQKRTGFDRSNRSDRSRLGLTAHPTVPEPFPADPPRFPTVSETARQNGWNGGNDENPTSSKPEAAAGSWGDE